MEKFYRLFLKKLKFTYDSFDRIVLNGYIWSFHNPASLAFYFKTILGFGFVNKKLLFSVRKGYKQHIESFAHHHQLSCEYIDKSARKDTFVEKYRRRFEKQEKFGVYYIMKAMENESTFRVVYPNDDHYDPENYLARARKPFTHYYFYIHDQILGNMSIRIASYLPFKITIYLNGHSYIERYLKGVGGKKALYKKRENAFLNIKDLDLLIQAKSQFTPELIQRRINHHLEIIGPKLEKFPFQYQYFIDQIEYARNFIFKGHFYLKQLFLRSCELGMHTLSSDRMKEIFQYSAKTKDLKKTFDYVEDGYYVFKAFFKRSLIKQYRKFSNFLRVELTCNHLPDFKLKKALVHLPEFQQKAEATLDRYCENQAVMMNCHADVDYFKKHSQPVMPGQTKIPAIHLYQERINRLLEVFLHDHNSIAEWKSMQLRDRILNDFQLPETHISRNQIIYDIRKLRAHGIVEKLKGANRYRLTKYGVKMALAFTLMRKRIYGPLHYSLFHHQPDHSLPTESKLERLYRQLDMKLNEIQEYIAGARAA